MTFPSGNDVRVTIRGRGSLGNSQFLDQDEAARRGRRAKKGEREINRVLCGSLGSWLGIGSTFVRVRVRGRARALVGGMCLQRQLSQVLSSRSP